MNYLIQLSQEQNTCLTGTALVEYILFKSIDLVPNIINLLEDSLEDAPIGETKSFIWRATPVGIAALWRSDEFSNSIPPFDEAVEEGVEVAMDLSREERESHMTNQGLVLLFYS